MSIPGGKKRAWVLTKIREALLPALQPWLMLEIKDNGGTVPLILLTEMGETSPRHYLNPGGAVAISDAQLLPPLSVQMEQALGYQIALVLDRIRADIVGGTRLDRWSLKLAKVYRAYLESGKPEDMPTVHCGAGLGRELEFPDKKLAPLPAHPDIECGGQCQYCKARAEIDRDYASLAVSMRDLIRPFFTERVDSNAGAAGPEEDIFSPSYSEADLAKIYSALCEMTQPILEKWKGIPSGEWGLAQRTIEVSIAVLRP
jgi:hypothetical protein